MTQRDAILKHMLFDGPITPLQALRDFGCMRLGARIHDLKRRGWKIKSEKVAVKTRKGKAVVCKYSLDDTDNSK